MTSASITVDELTVTGIEFTKTGIEFTNKPKMDFKSIFQGKRTNTGDPVAFNNDIDYVESELKIEKEDLRIIENNFQKTQLLSQLKYIEMTGDEWSEDNIKGPNEYVLNYSKELIDQIVDNGILPVRITQSVEEGISFVFRKNKLFLYLEIYNDKELGLLIEDYANKELLANKELFQQQEILIELLNFFSYV